ncbi:outer membrane protein [Edaphobacter bradus]|uniref:outer membrane protein n=1 Tax=Edaphobacter bradus TaxID=2259016 RepID=UPI0021E0BBF2|nr:hypothetical protein [Edaphobacter bradus]
MKSVATLFIATLVIGGAGHLQAQVSRRPRHESTANRKERIQRIIHDTYSHRYEVAGGGGYLRFRSGETLQKNNEVTFWMTGTRYFNPKLGITADIRGAYGHAKVGNTAFNIPNPQISQYNFMAGPTYRIYSRQKYAVSIYGVGGAALGKFDTGSKGIPSSELHLWETGYRPAFSVGANLDYNFFPNFAMRISPTYVGGLYRLSPNDTVTSKGSIQNNVGFNIGLLYRFGRIK